MTKHITGRGRGRRTLLEEADLRRRIDEMLDRGDSVMVIATELGCSDSTVRNRKAKRREQG